MKRIDFKQGLSKNGPFPATFSFSFVFSIQLTVYKVQYKSLPMTEFEPLTSGIGSNRCTNWATTTALKQRLSMRVQIAMLILLLANSFYCVYRSPKTFYAMVYETHSPPKGLLQEALTWWLFQIGISVAGNSLLYLGMELFSSWRWRLDRPNQKAVVFKFNSKNYARHAWHDSIVVWLLGRSSCSSPSTKELHGLVLRERMYLNIGR